MSQDGREVRLFFDSALPGEEALRYEWRHRLCPSGVCYYYTYNYMSLSLSLSISLSLYIYIYIHIVKPFPVHPLVRTLSLSTSGMDRWSVSLRSRLPDDSALCSFISEMCCSSCLDVNVPLPVLTCEGLVRHTWSWDVTPASIRMWGRLSLQQLGRQATT